MQLSADTVETEYEWVRERAPETVVIANDVRASLGGLLDASVDPITHEQYLEAVDTVFESGDLAVNVAALVGLLRNLDVEDDYPGFIVDELMGRELAGVIAGRQPLRLLGEATFHYADLRVHGDAGDAAGLDDLDAALAAGFQTRLPGWEWREQPDSFGL